MTQNKENEEPKKPFIGPIHRGSYAKKMDYFKNNCWTNDLETRKKHLEGDNYFDFHKKGRLYQEEKEEGTKMLTINLSGSIGDFEYILENCKEHIIMIQEHKQLQQEMKRGKAVQASEAGTESGSKRLSQRRMKKGR